MEILFIHKSQFQNVPLWLVLWLRVTYIHASWSVLFCKVVVGRSSNVFKCCYLFQNIQRTFKCNIPIVFQNNEMECSFNIHIIKKKNVSKIFVKTGNTLKGVVDWFFSRLDCVYGVQSSMCSCLFFLKTHYFSHKLPLFHTSLSFSDKRLDYFLVLWSPSLDGLRLVSWLSVLWLAKPPSTSKRPAPLLSGMRSGWIVNSGVVYNAYQFEPDWDPEDCAEPVQARLLMVCLVVVVSYF